MRWNVACALQLDSEYVRQLESGKRIQENSGRSGKWIIIATDADEDERFIGELRRSIECKDKFFALAAHELRGPLAPISSALTHLGQPMDEAAVVNQSCAVVARQVAQLGRLVDELSDLARLQSAQILLRRASVDLAATIASAVEAALPVIASRGHDLTVVAPLGATVVDGDAGRLTQVFANLLVNAAKFTDNRGRICVSVEREPDWVLVKVRDSGMGITREMLPRVFDPYVQVERGSGGAQSGLGLGLARHLIELHGGTVTAYSQGPGQGSEFVVRLPASHGQECSAGCLARTHSYHALT
jgi:signal transduction histidine kinase